MRAVAAFGVGMVAGVVLLRLLRPVLGAPALLRANYRGRLLPTAGGLVAVVATLAAVAVWWLFDAYGPVAHVLPVVLGFGLLGLLDDVLGSGEDGRGFGGHLGALAHGRLTTGGLKLLGGGAVGVAAAIPVDGDRPGRVVLDAALVALSANLGNLLDRAPGRTLKTGAVAAVVLVVAVGLSPILVGPAIAVGACLALVAHDLDERLMVGDTGANVLGGVLGLAVLLTVGFRVRMLVLLGVFALNVLSEVVSFSDVIDRVPVLRWVDRAGRRPGYPEVP